MIDYSELTGIVDSAMSGKRTEEGKKFLRKRVKDSDDDPKQTYESVDIETTDNEADDATDANAVESVADATRFGMPYNIDEYKTARPSSSAHRSDRSASDKRNAASAALSSRDDEAYREATGDYLLMEDSTAKVKDDRDVYGTDPTSYGENSDDVDPDQVDMIVKRFRSLPAAKRKALVAEYADKADDFGDPNMRAAYKIMSQSIGDSKINDAADEEPDANADPEQEDQKLKQEASQSAFQFEDAIKMPDGQTKDFQAPKGMFKSFTASKSDGVFTISWPDFGGSLTMSKDGLHASCGDLSISAARNLNRAILFFCADYKRYALPLCTRSKNAWMLDEPLDLNVPFSSLSSVADIAITPAMTEGKNAAVEAMDQERANRKSAKKSERTSTSSREDRVRQMASDFVAQSNGMMSWEDAVMWAKKDLGISEGEKMNVKKPKSGNAKSEDDKINKRAANIATRKGNKISWDDAVSQAKAELAGKKSGAKSADKSAAHKSDDEIRKKLANVDEKLAEVKEKYGNTMSEQNLLKMARQNAGLSNADLRYAKEQGLIKDSIGKSVPTRKPHVVDAAKKLNENKSLSMAEKALRLLDSLQAPAEKKEVKKASKVVDGKGKAVPSRKPHITDGKGKAVPTRKPHVSKEQIADAIAKYETAHSYATFKVTDSYKNALKRIQDALEDTETTDQAIDVAINALNEVPAEQAVAAVIEVLSEAIDILQSNGCADGTCDGVNNDEALEDVGADSSSDSVEGAEAAQMADVETAETGEDNQDAGEAEDDEKEEDEKVEDSVNVTVTNSDGETVTVDSESGDSVVGADVPVEPAMPGPMGGIEGEEPMPSDLPELSGEPEGEAPLGEPDEGGEEAPEEPAL